MPYVPLNSADIQAGKPTKEEIFTRIKENEDFLNTSVAALQGASLVDIFNIKFGGDISNYSEAEITQRIPVFRVLAATTITSFVATLLTASTSGTLEIDIERSTDDGVNWASLLNNPVQLTGTTIGSQSGTVDWISFASQSVDADDLLRIILTGVQVDQGEFHVAIYGELG